jgi:hypothetical protein
MIEIVIIIAAIYLNYYLICRYQLLYLLDMKQCQKNPILWHSTEMRFHQRARATTATSSGHAIMRGKPRGRATGTRRSAGTTRATTSIPPTSPTRTRRNSRSGAAPAPTRTAAATAPARTAAATAPTRTSRTTAAPARGTATGTARYGTPGITIGRGEWLMFGEGGADSSQHAQTHLQEDATVLDSTQEPPAI